MQIQQQVERLARRRILAASTRRDGQPCQPAELRDERLSALGLRHVVARVHDEIFVVPPRERGSVEGPGLLDEAGSKPVLGNEALHMHEVGEHLGHAAVGEATRSDSNPAR